MPGKKNSENNGGNQPQPRQTSEQPSASPPLCESADPVSQVVGIIERKVRNLEKRKNRLEGLQQNQAEGKELDRDQLEAVSKLSEVLTQLELAKDLQKQLIALNDNYLKAKKKQQKAEKQQLKESERDAQKSALAYSVRVHCLLDAFDDEAKSDFRKGTNGAVLLTEDQVIQLGDLYQLLVPTRIGNAEYQQELEMVGEHFLLLQEQSTKEVVGTTYRDLYNLLQKLDTCSYFDSSHGEEDQLSDEGMDDYKSADGDIEEAAEFVPTSVTPTTIQQPSQPRMSLTPPVVCGIPRPAEVPAPVPVIPQLLPQGTSSFVSSVPSVPSPTFPGLAISSTTPPAPAPTEAYSFMHKSEVCMQVVSTSAAQQSSTDSKVATGYTTHVPSTVVPASTTVPQSKPSQPAISTQDKMAGVREMENKASMDASTGQLSSVAVDGESGGGPFQQQGYRSNRGGFRGKYQGQRRGGPSRGGYSNSGYRNGRPGDSYGNQQSYRGSKENYQGRGDGGYAGGRGNGRGYQQFCNGAGNGRPNYTVRKQQ